MRNLAIIPARSGSKGLKDKNIKNINGKPMMAYTIEAALQSGVFSKIHVSTDNEVYAEIAEKYGADVPFLRPQKLALDEAGTWDVVRYVIQEYAARGYKFDTVAVLQPTSPLRDKNDILNAYNVYEEKKADSVMSLCEMEHTPLWSNTLPENHSLKNFILPENHKRRQELPIYYRPNGAIYIQNVELILQKGDLYGARSYAYIMPAERSIDIDNIFDFMVAEAIMDLSKKEC